MPKGQIKTSLDRGLFSALLDHAFHLESGSHFLDDFPVWDPNLSVPDVYRAGVFVDHTLVACGGVRLAKMHLNENSLQAATVAIIGAVATHSNYRGGGFGTQVVQHLTNWAEKRGATCVILWSSELEFYRRLGFHSCGEQIRLDLFDFTKDFLPVEKPENSQQVYSGWNPHLFDLVRKRRGGLALEQEDLSWFTAHKNVKWFYCGDPSQPKAYAALGRGIDLKDLVHEWGGDHSALAQIFQEVCKQTSAGGPISLLGSEYLFQWLGTSTDCRSYPGLRDPLCLIRFFSKRDCKLDSSFWFWGLDAA